MAENLRCPFCGALESMVTNSRPNQFGERRRHRKCLGCGSRFHTIESYAAPRGRHWTYPKPRVLAEPKAAADLYRERWEREHGPSAAGA